LNMLDDVCDYLHFVDRQKREIKIHTPGAAGS
jgi:hypothetical protein